MGKVFENHSWIVFQSETTDQYEIQSPNGQTCIAKRVRILSPDSFIIEHPVAVSLVVKTNEMAELPWVFRGDLEKLKDRHIEQLRRVTGLHLGGTVTRTARKHSRIIPEA